MRACAGGRGSTSTSSTAWTSWPQQMLGRKSRNSSTPAQLELAFAALQAEECTTAAEEVQTDEAAEVERRAAPAQGPRHPAPVEGSCPREDTSASSPGARRARAAGRRSSSSERSRAEQLRLRPDDRARHRDHPARPPPARPAGTWAARSRRPRRSPAEGHGGPLRARRRDVRVADSQPLQPPGPDPGAGGRRSGREQNALHSMRRTSEILAPVKNSALRINRLLARMLQAERDAGEDARTTEEESSRTSSRRLRTSATRSRSTSRPGDARARHRFGRSAGFRGAYLQSNSCSGYDPVDNIEHAMERLVHGPAWASLLRRRVETARYPAGASARATALNVKRTPGARRRARRSSSRSATSRQDRGVADHEAAARAPGDDGRCLPRGHGKKQRLCAQPRSNRVGAAFSTMTPGLDNFRSAERALRTIAVGGSDSTFLQDASSSACSRLRSTVSSAPGDCGGLSPAAWLTGAFLDRVRPAARGPGFLRPRRAGSPEVRTRLRPTRLTSSAGQHTLPRLTGADPGQVDQGHLGVLAGFLGLEVHHSPRSRASFDQATTKERGPGREWLHRAAVCAGRRFATPAGRPGVGGRG